MNKIDIKLGGHNLLREDFLFMQKQLSDAIKGLAEMTGSSCIILSGVVVTTPSTINWTAGWIYLNGELCEVQAGSAAYPANNTFVIVETYDAAGNQVYEDLTAEDTYIYRRATIQGNAGGVNLVSTARRMSEWFSNDSVDYISLNTVVAGAWQIPASGIIPTYRKNKAFDVELKGSLSVLSYASPGDLVMCTLPVGYRPAGGGSHRFVCSAIVNGTRTALHVEILDTGEVKVYGLAASDAAEVFLDNIVFPPDWDGF
jgi:hypothetical protein